MQLTAQYYYNYELDSSGTAHAPGEAKIADHKMVLGIASLTTVNQHQPGGSAVVGFTEFVQSGQVHNLPVPEGTILGGDITDVHWDFAVTDCHARASLLIMCFD